MEVNVGDMVRGMMKKRGIKINTDSIREFSISLKKREGSIMLAKDIKDELKKCSGNAIVDSIRNIEEVNYLREKVKNARIVLVAVTAPSKKRYSRMISRSRPDDIRNYEEFKSRDRKEERMGLERAISNADFIISNSASQSSLKASVLKLLAIIESKEMV